MSDQPNDLSPALGGGPAEWPFTAPRVVTFVHPNAPMELQWPIGVRDRLRRQRDEAYDGMRYWLAQREQDRHLAGRAMDVSLPDTMTHDELRAIVDAQRDNASSGRAIEGSGVRNDGNPWM